MTEILPHSYTCVKGIIPLPMPGLILVPSAAIPNLVSNAGVPLSRHSSSWPGCPPSGRLWNHQWQEGPGAHHLMTRWLQVSEVA